MGGRRGLTPRSETGAALRRASERAETRAGVSEIRSIHRAQEGDDSEAVASARQRSSNGPGFQTGL